MSGDPAEIEFAAILLRSFDLPPPVVASALAWRAFYERFEKCDLCGKWTEDRARCGFCASEQCGACQRACSVCGVRHCRGHLQVCSEISYYYRDEPIHRTCRSCSRWCRECGRLICSNDAWTCSSPDCDDSWCDMHESLEIAACHACRAEYCLAHLRDHDCPGKEKNASRFT